jgi:hypothetical protein
MAKELRLHAHASTLRGNCCTDLPNEENEKFSAESIGSKTPSRSRSREERRYSTVLQRTDYGEGPFLAGPEHGEEAHVQRRVDTCGKARFSVFGIEYSFVIIEKNLKHLRIRSLS